MQFSKPSKTTKNAEETVAPAPETSVSAESTSKPRSSKSSKSKKENGDVGTARHRRSSSPEPIENLAAVKAMSTSAGASSTAVDSPVIDPVGVMAPSADSSREVTQEAIAQLAHSYWIARGYTQGSAEEDWLRAERELAAKR